MIAAVDAGRAERDRLVERRDAQPVGAGLDEGPGDRDHPVAVGVGLDDRLDERRPGPPARAATARFAASASRSISSQAVRGSGGRPAAASRSSIGRRGPSGATARQRQARPRRAASPLGPGSARPASAGPPVAARPEAEPAAGRPPLGDRGEPLPGERDRLGQVRREQAGVAEPLADRVAGQAVEVDAEPGRGERRPGPGRGASRSSRSGRRPCRRVASAGFSNGATATDPSGAAMTVLAPFSTTTWPHVAAASRAAAARAASSSTRSPSSPGSRPLPARSRSNSPACGVRTAGRRSPSHQRSIVASERSASASSTIGGGVVVVRRREQLADELRGREARPQARARRRSRRARGRGSAAERGSGSTSSTSSSGRAIVVASTTFAANSGWSDSGTASVTRPAPARPAARQTRSAAPA